MTAFSGSRVLRIQCGIQCGTFTNELLSKTYLHSFERNRWLGENNLGERDHCRNWLHKFLTCDVNSLTSSSRQSKPS